MEMEKWITGPHVKLHLELLCNFAYCIYFFSNRVVNRWNMLDQQTAGATSLNNLKNGLDKLRKTKMGFFMD